MMNHIIDGEIDILFQAYRSEKKEIQKYNLALNLFKEDGRAAEFFKKLIADETLHMKWISEKIELIDAGFFQKHAQPEILTFKVNEEVSGKIKVVDMLNFSLLEEKSGALFHNFCMDTLENKNLKELFSTLLAAEIAHINSIKYEIDYLNKLSKK
ncbi:MAG TPA: hypothetical protein PKL57_02190 [Candidatus Wallbacteria bacterium]|nr:hypothetical protein [Candidatus Wallbacteria bacterium]